MEIFTQPETRAQVDRRIANAIRRMARRYERHGQEVSMMDPKLAQILISTGKAKLANVSDYETPDPLFQYDPRFHTPIRPARIVVVGAGTEG